MRRRDLLKTVAGASVLTAAGHRALAQSWPSKPVRLIVSFPAGGATDLVGRHSGSNSL